MINGVNEIEKPFAHYYGKTLELWTGFDLSRSERLQSFPNVGKREAVKITAQHNATRWNF